MHGEHIGVAVSPVVALSYLAVAGVLVGCAKFAVVAPASVETEAEVSEASQPA
jgi:AGZA family xanthine/uracil permease-like MFS transporter